MTISLESQLKDLICTSRPYFALDDIHLLTDTLMQCRITAENRHYGDASPICPSEAGRHLAILGSCLLAYTNPIPVKHYYLAFDALIKRAPDSDSLLIADAPTSNQFVGRAQLEFLDHKNGRVSTTLSTPGGQLVYTLTVSYKVMKADLFGKLFRNHYYETSPVAFDNPYARPIPLQHVRITPEGATAHLGLIQPEQCVGHFYHYPALPVAILSSVLLDLAGRHLKQLCGATSIRYANRSTRVGASRLAFAGEDVFLTSMLLHHTDRAYTFRMSAANAAGVPVGFLESTFDVL